MMSVRSLDERYLDFIEKTDAVFAQFPQLEPVRQFIFRELLIQQRGRTSRDISKHWLRPIVHRAGTIKIPPKADVLVLIEGLREVIVDALIPVYDTLVSRRISVQLVGAGAANNRPVSAYYLQTPTYVFAPDWARSSWNALCDSVKQLHCHSLQRSFSNFCCIIQGIFDGLDRILDDIDPKVVLIASTQLPTGASLATACRPRGIRTLLLQHGILQPFYLPLIADLMVTWGESSTKTFVELGVSPHRVVALGSPRHDSMLSSANGGAKRALLEALSLPERPTFIFFSNGNDLLRNGTAPYECAQWLETVAAQYSNDINVIVRLHPNEDASLYQNCPHLRITKETPDLALTLEGCDWVGSLCSTVLYDALLFKKPVWQFYADEWPELANNWRQGLALRISSQAKLSEGIERVLSAGSNCFVDETLSGRVFANQGHVAEAVVDFVQASLERTNHTTPGSGPSVR